MKLLFDANLSRRLVPMLADLFPGSTHVSLVGFAGEASDKTIWTFAKRQGFAIVTADADFILLAEAEGAPPQVVRLERMDYSTEMAARLLRRYAVALIEFEKTAKATLRLPKP